MRIPFFKGYNICMQAKSVRSLEDVLSLTSSSVILCLPHHTKNIGFCFFLQNFQAPLMVLNLMFLSTKYPVHLFNPSNCLLCTLSHQNTHKHSHIYFRYILDILHRLCKMPLYKYTIYHLIYYLNTLLCTL